MSLTIALLKILTRLVLSGSGRMHIMLQYGNICLSLFRIRKSNCIGDFSIVLVKSDIRV